MPQLVSIVGVGVAVGVDVVLSQRKLVEFVRMVEFGHRTEVKLANLAVVVAVLFNQRHVVPFDVAQGMDVLSDNDRVLFARNTAEDVEFSHRAAVLFPSVVLNAVVFVETTEEIDVLAQGGLPAVTKVVVLKT